ncbi:MAG: [protein-PII] uridylyltransferase [Burkholderiales bacterium]
MTPVAAWRERLRAEREALRAKFLAKPRISGFFNDNRIIVDRALRALWLDANLPDGYSLLAVGGYGRGELYPHSDIDILILIDASPSSVDSARLEAFVGCLWDIGLELGHAVRTKDQCIEEAAKEITVATSMLEARRLAGKRPRFEQFEKEIRATIDPIRFFHAKRLEQEQRHEKYNESPFSLEPNLKESPGGMRDLQVIRWVARAIGLGHRWEDLAERGLVTREEALQLRRVERFIQLARIQLHWLAGRREDRILFDHQGELAGKLKFGQAAHRRASEVLMQHYYRNAKTITQLNTIVLQNIGALLQPIDAAPTVLDDNFQSIHNLLDARDPTLFDRSPGAIFDSFLLLQKHSELKGMTAPTLRALWRARKHVDAKFRRNPINRQRFLEFLQQPRGIVHGLRRMNQYGILGRYLPAFGRIVGQMQHDLFHVYTVDQHILTVVRNLRRFTMLEFSHEYPLCSSLIANFERPWMLYVAALFHDIAKGRGGDHSVLGKVDALQFARLHDLAAEDRELLDFLVERHLTMSAVAQKQDLADPGVIRRFAEVVKTERRLVALYLLTVADIRGTSPKVWNAWKAKLLEDLFRYARRILRGASVDLDQDVQAKRAEALRLLRLYALSDGAKDALWSELDVAYFLRHDPNEIAWQTRNLHYRVNTTDPVVKARLSRVGEGVQVMIYCPDQQELFARICGYFEGIQFNIVDAKVHTTKHGYAFDTFQLLAADGGQDYRSSIAQIEHELADVLKQKGALGVPGQKRLSRQLRHFPILPEVSIRPDDKGQFHVLSVTAGDRPGLLYGIAKVLSRYELNLHTAKIATLGERAEDVFVIGGATLNRPRVVIQLETDLLAAMA